MNPAKKYPDDFRQRAVRMVREANRPGAVGSVAKQLGVAHETLRKWVYKANVDEGIAPGTPSELLEENKRLRKENFELKRANEILKTASAFFARELDQPRTK